MEHDGELLKQPVTFELVAEEHDELLQQPDDVNNVESKQEHDCLPLKDFCATEPVVESGEPLEESSNSDLVLQHNLKLLKQPEPIEPIAEKADKLLRQSMLEHNQETFVLSNTIDPVVEHDEEILRQFGSVDSETECDGELVKQFNNTEPVVAEAEGVLKPPSNAESVLNHNEELLKQSDAVQQVVEDDQELVKQCGNVESMLEDDGELAKQRQH